MLVAIILSLVWLSNSSNSDKVKDLLGSVFVNLSQIFKRKGRSRKDDGFVSIDEIPDSLRDEDGGDDEDYQKFTFSQADDDRAQALEDVDLLDTVKGRKMTDVKAYQLAQKKVPAVQKPGAKKDTIFD